MLLKVQVVWDVTLFRRTSSSRRFGIPITYIVTVKLQAVRKNGLFGPEDLGTTIVRNVGKYSSNNTDSHP
jgi:hypothetical protein